ncbi:MAG: hypothetical protein IJP38_05585 [Oscillospiraceae bacterium]|nr:hypothetical protein [Oscillospiraceae bacterium]MBQ9985761.1 hypothetical protein [Oscillospiraceae bacterium]
MVLEENKTTQPGIKRNPGECRFCGYVTPFDPDIPGFCCPVCGAQSGMAKVEEKTEK